MFCYSNIKFIYNGVDTKTDNEKKLKLDLRKKLKIKTGIVCLMLATYEKRKGHSFLFKAFQKVYEKYPDTHLVICGDGSKKEKEFVINQKRVLIRILTVSKFLNSIKT